MNSTKILFLKMLRNDIKRKACEKMGVDFNQVPKEKEELLTGQTIGRSDIESFSSYKLMNDDEKLQAVLGGKLCIVDIKIVETKNGTTTSFKLKDR